MSRKFEIETEEQISIYLENYGINKLDIEEEWAIRMFVASLDNLRKYAFEEEIETFGECIEEKEANFIYKIEEAILKHNKT